MACHAGVLLGMQLPTASVKRMQLVLVSSRLVLPDWLLTCAIRVTCSCDAVQACVCAAMQHRLHGCATHCDLSVMTCAAPGMHTSGCQLQSLFFDVWDGSSSHACHQ